MDTIYVVVGQRVLRARAHLRGSTAIIPLEAPLGSREIRKPYWQTTRRAALAVMAKRNKK